MLLMNNKVLFYFDIFCDASSLLFVAIEQIEGKKKVGKEKQDKNKVREKLFSYRYHFNTFEEVSFSFSILFL